jgi:hypothetical protein
LTFECFYSHLLSNSLLWCGAKLTFFCCVIYVVTVAPVMSIDMSTAVFEGFLLYYRSTVSSLIFLQNMDGERMHMGIEILACTKGIKLCSHTLPETWTGIANDLNIFVSLNGLIVVLMFTENHYCLCCEWLIKAQKCTSVFGYRTKEHIVIALNIHTHFIIEKVF